MISRLQSKQVEGQAIYGFRKFNKDVGVALVVLVALALGWLLRQQVVNRTFVFKDPGSPFKMEYPVGWTNADSSVRGATQQAVLLKVQDPSADSLYKTNL